MFHMHQCKVKENSIKVVSFYEEIFIKIKTKNVLDHKSFY
jgi:hypothetical protein